MRVILNLDDFIGDVDELTHESFNAADKKLREAIKKKIGPCRWNGFLKFFDTIEVLHSVCVTGLTKGRPKSAVKGEDELTRIWLDGSFCSYSDSESGLFYFHVGFSRRKPVPEFILQS